MFFSSFSFWLTTFAFRQHNWHAIRAALARVSLLKKPPPPISLCFLFYFYFYFVPPMFAWLVVWNVNDDDGDTGQCSCSFLQLVLASTCWQLWTKLSERVTCPGSKGRRKGVEVTPKWAVGGGLTLSARISLTLLRQLCAGHILLPFWVVFFYFVSFFNLVFGLFRLLLVLISHAAGVESSGHIFFNASVYLLMKWIKLSAGSWPTRGLRP